jgi:uncharacterized protein (DUF924 family)
MSEVSIPYEQIISLWFDGLEIEPGREFPMAAMKRWFMATEEFDAKCRYFPLSSSYGPLLRCSEYDGLIRQLVTLPFDKVTELASTPKKSLPVLILLDQISRNINRGSAVTFIYSHVDPLAVKLTHWCISQNHDAAHAPFQKLWYYMPLQHSENLADQELALSKNAMNAYSMRGTGWESGHPFASRGLGHSIEFYRTIEKFGRFPFRNEVLGRESSEEEKKFLEEGGINITVVKT